MNPKYTILTVVILSLFFSAFCQETKSEKRKVFELRGYIKDLQSAYFIEKVDSNISSNLIHNRLNFKVNFSNRLTLRLEFRNRIFYGEQIKLTPEFGKMINQSNNIYKLSYLWMDEKSIVIHSVIDRLMVRYTLKKWDLRLGRQRINWGINTIWNPNDIFNAYNFLDFDYEERPGTDALRIQRFFKRNAFLDFAYKPGKKKDEQIIGVLLGLNKWKYDFQFLSGIYQSDFLLGGGWAGSIKKIGFKGEMSRFLPVIEPTDKKASCTFSTMVERTFKKDWYASFGFLYTSNQLNTQSFGNSIYASNVSVKQLFPFRYSFQASAMKSFSPITSLGLTSVYSTEKNTLILFPTFSWSVSSNFDLNITAQSFFAKKEAGYRNLISGLFIRVEYSF